MIYFDNAATTKYKPEEVYKAFEYFVKEVGVSPGRGSYQLGIEASRMLYKTRKKEDIYDAISMETCVNKRLTIGAPGKEAMEKVIALEKEYLAKNHGSDWLKQ